MKPRPCSGCGGPLDARSGAEPALLVSPPNAEGLTQVLPLCADCWAGVPSLLGRLTDQAAPTRLLAEAFARLTDDEQAQVIIEVAAIAEEWESIGAPGLLNQWYAVGRHLRTCRCGTPEARQLVRMLARGVGDDEPAPEELRDR